MLKIVVLCLLVINIVLVRCQVPGGLPHYILQNRLQNNLGIRLGALNRGQVPNLSGNERRQLYHDIDIRNSESRRDENDISGQLVDPQSIQDINIGAKRVYDNRRRLVPNEAQRHRQLDVNLRDLYLKSVPKTQNRRQGDISIRLHSPQGYNY